MKSLTNINLPRNQLRPSQNTYNSHDSHYHTILKWYLYKAVFHETVTSCFKCLLPWDINNWGLDRWINNSHLHMQLPAILLNIPPQLGWWRHISGQLRDLPLFLYYFFSYAIEEYWKLADKRENPKSNSPS